MIQTKGYIVYMEVSKNSFDSFSITAEDKIEANKKALIEAMRRGGVVKSVKEIS